MLRLWNDASRTDLGRCGGRIDCSARRCAVGVGPRQARFVDAVERPGASPCSAAGPAHASASPSKRHSAPFVSSTVLPAGLTTHVRHDQIRPRWPLACRRISVRAPTRLLGGSCPRTRIRPAARSSFTSESLVRVLPARWPGRRGASRVADGRARVLARPLPQLDAHSALRRRGDCARLRAGWGVRRGAQIAVDPPCIPRMRARLALAGGLCAPRRAGTRTWNPRGPVSFPIGDVIDTRFGHASVACRARHASRVSRPDGRAADGAWRRVSRCRCLWTRGTDRGHTGRLRTRTRGGWSRTRERLGACHCSLSLGGWPRVPVARPMARSRRGALAIHGKDGSAFLGARCRLHRNAPDRGCHQRFP